MYYELNIVFNQKNYNSICSQLYLNGITAILEESSVIKVYFKQNERVRLERIKKNLFNSSGISPSSTFVSALKNHDWNKEWKDTIEPVYIKDRIIIYSSWKKPRLKKHSGKILIEIDPKMSFGTGHSETTQLILELMCDYITEKDNYLLDYGCGTSILAIASIKLGIKKAVAIDIDNDSIINSKENFKNNKVEKEIKLHRSDIGRIKETHFDVVVCNIDKTIITKNLKYIHLKLIKGGKLFLTGILNYEKDGIESSLEKNQFSLQDVREKGEWIALYTRKL
jgi:ribosomal protein L11 methyltransferase